MKNKLRLLAVLLVMSIIISTFGTGEYQAAELSVNNSIYTNAYQENIEIDGIIYTYKYFLENGHRVIQISNDHNDIVEEVRCNALSVEINGEEIEKSGMQTRASWEYAGTTSHYISWPEGTTVAVIAALIALYIPGSTAAVILAKGGFTALSVIAANSSGGTLYIEVYCLQMAYQPTQYMYKATFVAGTGDVVGPMTFLQG